MTAHFHWVFTGLARHLKWRDRRIAPQRSTPKRIPQKEKRHFRESRQIAHGRGHHAHLIQPL